MIEHTPIKQTLLNVLKRNDKSSMKDIMLHFKISDIAIRKHINELVQKGFIKVESVKQEIGRPYYIYELTSKGHETFPNQYESLPVELLQDLEELQGVSAVKGLLTKRMERESASFQNELGSSDFDERMAQFVKLQDAKGYMIDYEKQADGSYEMNNYNCPIINLATAYEQLCTNEKQVLEEIFPASEVVSSTSIVKGDPYCKWIIKKPTTDI